MRDALLRSLLLFAGAPAGRLWRERVLLVCVQLWPLVPRPLCMVG